MDQLNHWQHVEHLFHAALSRHPSERTLFLREACGDDEALRREVESLLEYENDAQQFMQTTALAQSPELIQPTTSLVGRCLGPYEIGSLLGAGGMGDVYRARDTTLGRDVAIKILPAAFTADANRRVRFEREARHLAALNHPHIGAIYGFEQRDGIQGLILELVEGHTLAERLRGGPLPVREAMRIARQIADALDAAHEKGIVHRDLKPSNVAMTPDGVVKVLDFGLAKADGAESGREGPLSAPDDTHDGLILGTVAYMSPEQARGRRVDKRTDVWAFGCVLWEMLTGGAPFAGDTRSDTIAAILNREPRADALPPDTPANVRRLLRRCLEKDPKRRLRDIGDAQLELDDDDAVAEVSTATSKSKWSEAAAWTAAGACALVALIGGWYAMSTRPTPVRLERFHVLPPGEGPISDVALSPDGHRLAFVAPDANRERRLWVRATDSLDARAIAGTEGARSPFWSPDGQFIAFYAQGKLRKIAADGGAPQVLCDAAEGSGGTWSPSGIIVFSPVANGGLYQVSANGGSPVPVTSRTERQTGHRFPQFLPDGRRFLFLAQTGRDAASGIYVASLDSPETTPVLETAVRAQYAPPGYLLFVRDNSLMAQMFDLATLRLSGDVVAVAEDVWNDTGGGTADFAVAEGVLAYRERERNLGELVWVDRAGQPLGRAGERADYIHPWLSPDGRRAVVELIDPDTQVHSVWMLDVVRGARSPFVRGPAQSHFPVWSPDGRQILFSSDRGGPWSLFVRSASGATGDEELFASSSNSLAIDWSRDGRFILYQTVDPSTRADIWALPMAPRGHPFAVANSARNERQAQLSPDGRWVAYASDESGRDEIWVQGFPEPREKWPVSASGGSQPQWRRDGRELYYISRDLKLMAVAVNSAASSFDAGVPTPLFALRFTDQLSARNNFMPTADGRRFLINTSYAEGGTGSLAVVLGWPAAASTHPP